MTASDKKAIEQILEVLKEGGPDGMSLRGIAAALSMGRNRVRRLVRIGEAAGVLRHNGGYSSMSGYFATGQPFPKPQPFVPRRARVPKHVLKAQQAFALALADAQHRYTQGGARALDALEGPGSSWRPDCACGTSRAATAGRSLGSTSTSACCSIRG